MSKVRGKTLTFRVLFVLFAIAALTWVWSVWARVYDNPPMVDDYTRDDTIVDVPEDGIRNILVLGLDQRGTEPGRADTIIIMSINEKTDKVALISIPRDSRVEVPGEGKDKINHAMASGGISLMRATVEELLGVPIHHYIHTNFVGFEEIIDTVGGVTIDVDKRIQNPSSNIVLKPGVQHLNGIEALQYVRFRKDSEGDFGRMRRQQHFLTATADEVLQAKNIVKLPALLEQAARHLRTDMSIPQLLSFARKAASINIEEVADRKSVV